MDIGTRLSLCIRMPKERRSLVPFCSQVEEQEEVKIVKYRPSVWESQSNQDGFFMPSLFSIQVTNILFYCFWNAKFIKQRSFGAY